MKAISSHFLFMGSHTWRRARWPDFALFYPCRILNRLGCISVIIRGAISRRDGDDPEEHRTHSHQFTSCSAGCGARARRQDARLGTVAGVGESAAAAQATWPKA